MNIKSKDFLERIELSEKKNSKLALSGLVLAAGLCTSLKQSSKM